MYFFIRVLIMVCTLFCAANVSAEIFKCKKFDGTIYFFEQRCAATDQEQAITKRDLVLMRFELQQKHADIIREQRQRIRADLTADKLRAAEEKRRLRLKAKCETVRQQITQLNLRYKQGYTLTQGRALDRKLAECNNRKARYCTNE
jgi:hypothetical protein